ncbi:hypothetical protein ACFQPF_17390 [Fictibacillus iocasae]|uniref:Uncharacterized protein n=1 Tax=Fictibacillus iocasae TaxID=2715437 RepID=A0ABW2NVL3_9BACL
MRKVYIVEGIPGSGKTTTAQWLKDVLRDKGRDVRLFLEGNVDHPADYESTACLTEDQLLGLEKDFTEIRHYAQKKETRYFIQYRKLPDSSSHLRKALKAYDVYELPVNEFIQVSLQKWKEFVEQAVNEDTVYVLECCFLQNPITFLLAKHNCDKKQIAAYIKDISVIISELNPAVLYFEQDNVEESVGRVIKERSKEWLEFIIWYYTEQAYGQARGGVKGESGFFAFLHERKQLEKELLNVLPIESLVLNNSAFDWDERKREIISFIE